MPPVQALKNSKIRLKLIREMLRLATAAGEAIITIYEQDFTVEIKKDASPVTEADRLAEKIIVTGLQKLNLGYEIVAEESISAGYTPEIGKNAFFLIDPLDGTRQFIERNGQFTVNIALVENGIPTLGVIHLPALQETYWTNEMGGANKRSEDGSVTSIQCRTPNQDGLVVLATRSHNNPDTDAFLEKLNIAKLDRCGSSLKFCRIAEGSADLYPRLGRTMEWDIAAGHAILVAAGGKLTDLAGNSIQYGKTGFESPHFVATGAE